MRSISSVSGIALLRGETAHLDDDRFRDLGAVRPDDRFGDAVITQATVNGAIARPRTRWRGRQIGGATLVSPKGSLATTQYR